jgi:hypothetical protein
MTYGSFQAPGTQYQDPEQYLTNALAPGFVNALDRVGITPTQKDVNRLKDLIRGCVIYRNSSKTTKKMLVPAETPLEFKVTFDDQEIYWLKILKKGEFVTIDYCGVEYTLHQGQIAGFEISEQPDDEIYEKGIWAQYMIYKTAQEEATKEAPIISELAKSEPVKPKKSLNELLGDISELKKTKLI